MLKSCKYCGRVHAVGAKCLMKPARRKYDYSDRIVRQYRNTNEWKRIRETVRERDHYMCVYCLKNKRIVYDKIEVHHIIPIEEDYDLRNKIDNLITLCRRCHEEAEKGNITRKELSQLVESNSC